MTIDTDALRKQVILHLPYLLFLLVFAKLGEAVRLAPGADAAEKFLGLSEGFTMAFQSMWPGSVSDWIIGLLGAIIMRLAVYLKGKDAKKYRKNVEYGSARWGTKNDIAPYMDPKPENNIILEKGNYMLSLVSVWMYDTVTNEKLDALVKAEGNGVTLDENNMIDFDVKVLSQGVQTEGFANYDEAMASFGDVLTNVGDWFTGTNKAADAVINDWVNKN